MNNTKRPLLSSASFCLACGVITYAAFIVIDSKNSGFATHCALFIMIASMPFLWMFCERTGLKEKIDDIWDSFPQQVHVGICLVAVMTFLAIIPKFRNILKTNYVKK